MAAGCWLLASASWAGSASAQCGQRTTGYPAHWAGGGPPPLVIGDSVLYDAVPALARLGFQSDAMVCRQMSQGLALLLQRGSSLPHLVVLELGTNGSVTLGNIGEALQILGPRRLLVMITPHNGVVPSDDNTIITAQRLHPSQMLVLDWNDIADGHPFWFAPDGIHLGNAAGIAAFAQMVAGVLPYAWQPPCGG
ncbi:MAG: hypothetical protein ACLP8S_15935 [Solirubrobacteraceae bacterium]